MQSLPRPIAELVALHEEARRLGPFTLLRQLGHGGFAPVWLAREEYAGKELRTVAIKLFAYGSDGSSEQRDTERVLDEARTLCRVEHPSVVRFHAVAIDKERKIAGFAMEHLAGPSLEKVLEADGAFSVTDAIEVGIAVASALAAVHRAGIVHRDVKPGNIIETSSGYKLIDFGIALGARDSAGIRDAARLEIADISRERVRQTRSTIGARRTGLEETTEVEVAAGTIGYMDPECLARSRPAVPASDLYSLGATLFELVSGSVPAEVEGKLLGEILDGRKPAPRLANIESGVNEDFAELVAQLLAAGREDRPRSADWVLTKLEQLRHAVAGRRYVLPDEEVGPFRGLSRFDVDDGGVYFGRSLEIAQALHVLRVRGLVALVGPSGSGKSSLASAGLLPAVADGLLQAWPEEWDTVSVSPGLDPRARLSEALAPFTSVGPQTRADELLANLAQRIQASGRGLVLLLDQLEELATVSERASRDWMIDFVARAAEQALPGFRVIVTARRDLLDPLLEFAGLGRVLLQNAVLIEPMTPLTWAEVLDQALAAYGYRFEDAALRDELIREISRTASAMPLVGFALSRLWEMRDREYRTITRRALRSLGGITGALAQHAENTLEALRASHPAAGAAARSLLLSLTTALGTRAVREPAELSALAGDASAAFVSAFENARILVRTPSGLTLAHEVLLGEWQTLRSWVSEARETRLLVEELEQDAARHAAFPDRVPLWQRRRLLALREVASRERALLSQQARRFVQSSERVLRRRWVVAASLSVAVVLGLASAGAAYVVAINAEKGRTQLALERERGTRRLAEQRTQEVQTAQQRIDELLRDMKDSPTKEAVRALQAQIRDEGAPSKPAPRTSPRQPELGRQPTLPPITAAAATLPSAVAPPTGIKVQNEW